MINHTLQSSKVISPKLTSAGDLSDGALVARVKQLAAREREATVLLIAHLAELDRRRLYLAEGCSSLFTYCTEVLQLSEHAAYGRIEAARAARRFPVILEHLEAGVITLTTVCLLAGLLTEANHDEVLEAARHKSKRQVEELVARLRPLPPVPSLVRRLPAPLAARSEGRPHLDSRGGAGGEAGGADPSTEPGVLAPATSPAALSAPVRPAVIAPLAPGRYKVQFTASAETHEKLRMAQALLRHQIPDGDPAVIFDRALTVLLESLTRQKLAATNRLRVHREVSMDRAHEDRADLTQRSREEDRPCAPACGDAGASACHSRHIPAEVRREVWRRDGGRCAFIGANGRRCSEQGFLKFHHIVRYSVGGPATVENIQLRCRAHNGYEAEVKLGLDRADMVRGPCGRTG